MSNGNVSSLLPYKAYLVEDYARDLDAVYYLNGNAAYSSSAFKTEAFVLNTYLQPSGNITLPRTGQGLDPVIAIHLILIANDIKGSSEGDRYQALTQASKIINYTISIQNQDGTFRFYTNSSNPGFAYTTISSVSTIVDSYEALCSSSVPGIGGCRSTNSYTTITRSSFRGSTTTSSAGFTTQGSSSGPLTSLLSALPSWVFIAIPVVMVIVVAITYEARHRAGYRGMVDK
jgi:hypothetical protein